MSNNYSLMNKLRLVSPSGDLTTLDEVGFINTSAGVNVTWSQINTLEFVTSAVRLPTTPNQFLINDTFVANDNYLAPTRTAVLSAPPLVEPSLTLTNITSGGNSVLTTQTLTLTESASVSTNSAVLYANGTLQLNDIGNGSVLSLTPDSGLGISVLPFPSTKYANLDAYNGLGITDGTSNSSVSATQIQVIDNDPSYLDPKSTTITPTSISVIAGVGELDTQITNQEVKVRNSNDLFSTLSPTAVSFTDSVTTAFLSSLTATTLQLTDGPGNLDANLNNSNLTFYNGNTSTNTYSLGINGSDLVINAGGDRLLLNSNVAESYWGDYTAGTNANICLNLAGACRADIDIRAGEFSVGDLNSAGNNTKIVINDSNPSIALQTTGAIEVDSGAGLSTIGDVNGSNNGTTMSVDDTTQVITLTAGNGVYLQSSTIRYASNLLSSSTTLAINDTYSQTFNGSSLTATLPLVDGTNVGFQFLITNTNASSLSVVSTGGQLIYSSTGTASATTRTLPVGHSHIFTTIYTTSLSTYGWSMV